MNTKQQYRHSLNALISENLAELISSSNVGLEKESLRVTPDGTISQSPHPKVLGSTLTHQFITTDYSEALMEFITPPFEDIKKALAFLCQTQKFVYHSLQDEILWATSMPCVVEGSSSIPIAQYGDSNLGMMKTVYRRGLGHRYGRTMQVIAGVHYNYSFAEEFWQTYQKIVNNDEAPAEFVSSSYMALIRNLLRFGWLVPYLFGASPAVCKSFFAGGESNLQVFNESTYYEPYATSLRMGDIGYQNNKEGETGVCINYNSLEEYVASLTEAINTPCPEYEKIGIVQDGEFQQLNSNLLQIENEYYSSVRPKQLADTLEKPSLALKKRGIRYIELRSLDVNAYDPLGINEQQLYFLEAFILYCLLKDSPPIDRAEKKLIDANIINVAHNGRDPKLKLHCVEKSCSLKHWAGEIMQEMQPLCEALDKNRLDKAYSQSLKNQEAAVNDPELTPSARMIREMRENKEGFYHFALRMSQKHRRYFKEVNMLPQQAHEFEELSKSSLQKQAEIEAQEQVDFSDFLQSYFNQS